MAVPWTPYAQIFRRFHKFWVLRSHWSVFHPMFRANNLWKFFCKKYLKITEIEITLVLVVFRKGIFFYSRKKTYTYVFLYIICIIIIWKYFSSLGTMILKRKMKSDRHGPKRLIHVQVLRRLYDSNSHHQYTSQPSSSCANLLYNPKAFLVFFTKKWLFFQFIP